MEPGGVTRRGLFRKQVALGAGYLAADALFAEPAAANTEVTVHPRLYPLTTFTPEVDLSGKVAVVTGASSGIGRAAGEALAAAGVHVIGTSRDVAGVRRPPGYPLLNLDVSDSKSVDAFVRRVRREVGTGGRVDILVNNAGRGVVGNVLPPSGGEARYHEQLQLGLRTNYLGHLMVTRRMLPLLPTQGYARVCFTVSIAAYTVSTASLAWFHGYTATKRSLLAFANAWRSTLGPASNIGVTTVNPYLVNTRFPQNLILTERAPRGSGMAQVVDTIRRTFGAGIPASLVGQAYWQLLSSSRPPANVAAGSSAEPYATMGGNRPTDAAILAENAQGAIEFAL